MTTTETFTPEEVAEVLGERTPAYQKIDRALVRGDMRGLTIDQLDQAKVRLAEQMGIDPAFSPIDFIPDKKTGRLVPYINSRGAAFLRRKHGLEVTGIEVVVHREGLVVLRCVLRGGDGRTDQALGAASWLPDMPTEEARAWLVAETRAKRRATMSAVGIFLEGPSDEVEGEPNV